MKRMILFSFSALFVSCLLLSSCANKNESSSSPIIEKENLYELIIRGGKLIPGDGLEWYIDKTAFLESDYSSDKLNPASEEFEEHRINNSADGTTGITPVVEIKLKKYNIAASSIFLFDEDDKLIKVCYRQLYPSDSIDKYADVLTELCKAADEFDELFPENPDLRDLTNENILENPISIKWHHISEPTYFQINSVNFQNNLIMDLMLSVDD